MGNAAYLYISIAFIQMLKALMVVAVYGFGVALGTEVLTGKRLVNVSVISLGVVIASYGGAQCCQAFWGSGSCACPGSTTCVAGVSYDMCSQSSSSCSWVWCTSCFQ